MFSRTLTHTTKNKNKIKYYQYLTYGSHGRARPSDLRLSRTMLPKIRDVFSNLPRARAQGHVRICNILQRQTQKRTSGTGCFTRALRRKLHAGTAYLGGNKLLRPREPTSVQECACSKTWVG
jgi:hypothetical protein